MELKEVKIKETKNLTDTGDALGIIVGDNVSMATPRENVEHPGEGTRCFDEFIETGGGGDSSSMNSSSELRERGDSSSEPGGEDLSIFFGGVRRLYLPFF